MGVADGVGDRVVDPGDVRRPSDPAAADLQPLAVAVAGALDEAACEAVISVRGTANDVEDAGLALEYGVAQPVSGSSCLASRGHD